MLLQYIPYFKLLFGLQQFDDNSSELTSGGLV